MIRLVLRRDNANNTESLEIELFEQYCFYRDRNISIIHMFTMIKQYQINRLTYHSIIHMVTMIKQYEITILTYDTYIHMVTMNQCVLHI